MSNEEAKFILGAYRPNGSDAENPVFAEALRQAQLDPTLRDWFARERARDTAIARKLTMVAPPAGLRDAILAGARAGKAATPKPRRVWLGWLAAAAALAIALSVFGLRSRADARVGALTAFALEDAREATPHGSHGEPASVLRHALTAESTRLGNRLPVDFASLAKSGCRELNLSGTTVLELCFNRGGQWFHCYIVRCQDLPGASKAPGPVYASKGAMNAVAWSDGTYRFVVAGAASREVLQRLL